MKITYVCPKCANPITDLPEISSGSAAVTCQSCGWEGTENYLLAAAMNNAVGSHSDITQPLVNDLRKLLSSGYALSIAQFLIRWGFIESGGATPYVLGRYIAAIANSTLAAIIKERLALVQEKSDGN